MFEIRLTAVCTKAELIEKGVEADAIDVLQGKEVARDIDTRARWFADTDVWMKRFQRELLDGNVLIVVPVETAAQRAKVHQVIKAHNPQYIAHFGEWITEVMK